MRKTELHDKLIAGCMDCRQHAGHSSIIDSGLKEGCMFSVSMQASSWGACRKDRECGQIGVNRMAGTMGWTMDPPAATEYAVLPVGVASITPSACTCTATHSFTSQSFRTWQLQL